MPSETLDGVVCPLQILTSEDWLLFAPHLQVAARHHADAHTGGEDIVSPVLTECHHGVVNGGVFGVKMIPVWLRNGSKRTPHEQGGDANGKSEKVENG